MRCMGSTRLGNSNMLARSVSLRSGSKRVKYVHNYNDLHFRLSRKEGIASSSFDVSFVCAKIGCTAGLQGFYQQKYQSYTG